MFVVLLVDAGRINAQSLNATQVSESRRNGPLTTFRGFADGTAFDGGWLVQSEEVRQPNVYPSRVFVMRLRPDGEPIDPTGIAVAPQWPLHQGEPASSCIGVRCLIVWRQDDRGPALRTFDAMTGQWGQAALWATDSVSSDYVEPAVATDGERFFIAWNASNPDRVLGAIADQNGELQGARLTLINSRIRSVRLAYGNDRFALVGLDETTMRPRTVVAALFDRNGGAVSGLIALGSTNQDSFPGTVAPTADGFLFAFPSASSELVVRALTTAASFRDAGSLTVAGGGVRSFPALASSEDAIFLAWKEGDSVSYQRLRTPDLSFIGAPERVPESPTIALRWAGGRTDKYHLLLVDNGALPMALVAPDGGMRPNAPSPGRLSGPDIHRAPAVLATQNQLLVAYTSLVADEGTPLLQTLNLAGAPVSPVTVLADAGTTGTAVTLRRVNGAPWAFLTTGRHIIAGPLAPSGEWTSSAVRSGDFDSAGAGPVGVSAHDGYIVMAWVGSRASETGTWTWMIASDGGTAWGPTLAVRHDWHERRPAVSASSSQLLVSSLEGTQLFAQRFDVSGRAISGSRVRLSPLSSTSSAASDGANFLIAFTDGPKRSGVVRIDSDGGVVRLLTFETADGPFYGLGISANASEPLVLFDGTRFQLTWSHATSDGGGLDLRRRTLTVDGDAGLVEHLVARPGDQYAYDVDVSGLQRAVAFVEPEAVGVGRVWLQVESLIDGGAEATSDGGSQTDARVDAGDPGPQTPQPTKSFVIGCHCQTPAMDVLAWLILWSGVARKASKTAPRLSRKAHPT